jgi:uncharacterized membrane protein YdjX (TVP38/TMEM64 family)
MKKYLGIASLALFVIIVSILGVFFHKTILNFLIDIDVSRLDFLFVYLLICIIYFHFPLPAFFVILLNGYLFKDVGFYISFSIIIFSSTTLFFCSRAISNFFDLNIKAFFLKKNIKIEKITSNSLSILISRYIVPFFFHNIYYGIMAVNFRKFFIIIFLAEIPLTYAINSIGKSLKNFTIETNYSIINLFIDINFYIPFIIIIFIYFFVEYIRRSL